jgi:Lipopolysaccharide-assembly
VSRRRCAAALILATTLVWRCGYRFAAGGPPLPEGIREVYAPVFVNRTGSNPITRLGETYRAANEPGVEAIFTQAFREQLLRAGVAGGPNSEARIEGEILSVDTGPTVLTVGGRLASYRVAARLRLRLVKNGRQLSSTDVTGFEDFIPSREVAVLPDGSMDIAEGDVLRTETNRMSAIKRLAETMTRDGYDRLATGW